MRCADERAEMSIVSSPATPSMVMVLGRRLVCEKSPITWMLSPPMVEVPAAGSDPLTRISSMSVSSAMMLALVGVPPPIWRVTTISVPTAAVLPPPRATHAARV